MEIITLIPALIIAVIVYRAMNRKHNNDYRTVKIQRARQEFVAANIAVIDPVGCSKTFRSDARKYL